MNTQRRVFLGLSAAGAVGWGVSRWLGMWAVETRRIPARVRIAEVDGAGRVTGLVEVPSIRKSDEEWRATLALDQFMITRRGDTEFAYSGEYWNFHGDGIYRCVCCGTALFDSRTKFNSGTGWPSFTEPVAKENVAEAPDTSYGLSGIEVSCRRCGGHLGHVFEDGPPPTGRRFCIDSVAIKFVGREAPGT